MTSSNKFHPKVVIYECAKLFDQKLSRPWKFHYHELNHKGLALSRRLLVCKYTGIAGTTRSQLTAVILWSITKCESVKGINHQVWAQCDQRFVWKWAENSSVTGKRMDDSTFIVLHSTHSAHQVHVLSVVWIACSEMSTSRKFWNKFPDDNFRVWYVSNLFV